MNNIESEEFIPILLGNDMNAYGMAYSFNEVYGKICQAYASDQLVPTRYSKIANVEATPGFDKDPAFIGTMLRLAKEGYSDKSKEYLLVACGNGYAESISQHKQELPEYFICPYTNYSLSERLIDKVSFYEVYEEYDLPYPKTLTVREEMLVSGYLEQELPFEFPAVLKPADSVEYLFVQSEGRKKASILETREELGLTLGRTYEAGYKSKMTVQGFTPGDDSNMCVLNAYVDEDHQVRMMYLGHPLLEDLTPASTGNYVVVIPGYNEKIYQTIKAFLEKIEYTGSANLDMKYDPRDGEYRLSEINLRQGCNSFSVILNGLNLARLVTEDRVFSKPFVETTYGTNRSDKVRLWMGVPKKIFLEYARENEDKKLAEQMIKENRYGTTVFYKRDRLVKRQLLMKYVFHNYTPRFKKYFYAKEGQFMKNSFSILGGMGTMVTESLVRLINHRTKVTKGQECLNYISFNHAAVPDRTAYILDRSEENPMPLLPGDIEKQNLLRSNFTVLTYNIVYYFFKELQAATDTSILHMPREVANELVRQHTAGRVTILGTEGSMKVGIYECEVKNPGFETVIPDTAFQEKINYLIYHEIKELDHLNWELYYEILEEAAERLNCEKVTLGCTELSSMHELVEDNHCPVIDAQSILVNRMIERALAERSEVLDTASEK